MTTRPTITVVTAAYNAADTVGALLTSVLTQDYPGIDVVVVDDGSADATATVVQGYVDAGYPVTLVRQENRGCAGARNTGLRAATGDFIAAIDADDELLPGFFTRMMDAYDAAGGGRRLVAANAYLLTPGGLDPKRTVLRYGAPAEDEQVRAILAANFSSIFTLFPRTMLDEIGEYREELPTCEDWDLWARAVVHGWRIALITDPIALYRWTAGSMSSSGEKMARGEEMVLANLRERHGDLLSPADLAYLDERIAAGSLMTLMREADDALRAGDVEGARTRYETVARLNPGDRRSALKARSLGLPGAGVVAGSLWRRRLLASDAATGRDKAGR